ncbi:hypothetical protein Tco_1281602 [Tanacetum coccineum]
MVKMVPYEAFACPCGAGDVVLRESYKPKTRGKLYYACPRSKPRENTFGCKKNLWKEERVRLLVGSPGASTTPIYSPGSSSTPIYSPGSSTPPRYSPSSGASTSKELPKCLKNAQQPRVQEGLESPVLTMWDVKEMVLSNNMTSWNHILKATYTTEATVFVSSKLHDKPQHFSCGLNSVSKGKLVQILRGSKKLLPLTFIVSATQNNGNDEHERAVGCSHACFSIGTVEFFPTKVVSQTACLECCKPDTLFGS